MCALGTELRVMKKAVANIAFIETSFGGWAERIRAGRELEAFLFEVLELSFGFSLALHYAE